MILEERWFRSRFRGFEVSRFRGVEGQGRVARARAFGIMIAFGVGDMRYEIQIRA